MRPATEHQRVVRDLIRPTVVRDVPLADGAGRALAREVLAPIALPSFDSSSMDGYAVRAADVADAADRDSVSLPVTADIAAGETRVQPLEARTSQRIMTGAPMPPGADTVVPVEATDAGTETVRIFESRALGQHVRAVGCDVQPGDRVLPAGTTLLAPQLGVLSALGIDMVPVHAPVRVLVLSTGSELVAHGTAPEFGQIHDANSVMLATALTEIGAEPIIAQFVADDVPAFLSALSDRAREVDLVVTSGGVSAGAYEVVKEALQGHPVEFVKVALQPGMPQGAGTIDDVPIVCLPGNPVSAFVSFEVFLRPALLRAMGHAVTDRPAVRVEAAEAMSSPAGKRQLRRGVVDLASRTVHLKGSWESHFLGSLAAANCLLDIPEHVTEVRAGEPVDVWLLRS